MTRAREVIPYIGAGVEGGREPIEISTKRRQETWPGAQPGQPKEQENEFVKQARFAGRSEETHEYC